ncbi:MAG TPA: AAA family ATPase [Acidimicrobiales bacterium]|nr:AAA family ATPase [Acidimicrobiales bacterium]
MKTFPPYRPFRGVDPPHFVDRPDHDLGAPGACTATLEALRHGPSDPSFHRLVVGGPAMGKTAFLRAVGRAAANELGWAFAHHRCRAKERALATLAGVVLSGVERRWRDDPGGRAETGLRSGPVWSWPRTRSDVAAGTAIGGEATWAQLRRVLHLAGRFASGHRSGLLVALDDVDRLSWSEIEALGHMARDLSRHNLPIALLLSSGQVLEARLARSHYFESSFWPARLEPFDRAEAREALVLPALDLAVEYDEGALELLAPASGGAPLELQRLGFAAWSAADDGGVVSLAAAEEALGVTLQLGAAEPAALAS